MTKSTTKRKTTTTRRKTTTSRTAKSKAAPKTTAATAEASAPPEQETAAAQTTAEQTPETASADAPAPTQSETPDTTAAAPAGGLRKKELIDRVVALSGMKKKDVKPVVEAMLAVLGDALSCEEQMMLQPMGKVMIKRRKEVQNGEVLELRIRRSTKTVENDGTDPLAEAAE